MSGTISIRSSDATQCALNAWRQRGYDTARAGRIARPPALDGAAKVYMDGYRRGDRKR